MKVPVPIIDAETKRLQYRVMSEYKYIIMSYLRARMAVPDTEGIGCNL